jgi:hypothetical protein
MSQKWSHTILVERFKFSLRLCLKLLLAKLNKNTSPPWNVCFLPLTMSAADDNTTRPPLTSGSTWIQLYCGEEAVGIPIEIVAARNAYHLTELVKEKRAVALQYCDAADLVVYPPGTPLNDLSNNNRLGPVESVPGGRTEAQPLIVMAPGKCL